MGTHPIFESDFDCLTEEYKMSDDFSDDFFEEALKETQAFNKENRIPEKDKPRNSGASLPKPGVLNVAETKLETDKGDDDFSDEWEESENLFTNSTCAIQSSTSKSTTPNEKKPKRC